MKYMAILLSYFSICVISSSCTISTDFGPYYGRVIDAGTKKPIEGAVVLVVFKTESIGPAGSMPKFSDALETTTDKNGDFSFPKHGIKDFKVLQMWDMYGHFTVFKPGYGCYPMNKDAKPKFIPNGTLPLRQHVTIELPRLETKEERIESTMCSPRSDIPTEKADKLIDLINQERKNLGYNSIRK